jgi:hypothetical protein
MALSAGCFALSLFGLWCYYYFYFRWASKFNEEGRYFDGETVWHSDSREDIYFFLVFFLLGLVFLLAQRAVKNRAGKETSASGPKQSPAR